MTNTLYKLLKFLILFLIGGFTYISIEIGFRGYSHISMFITGAICFILIGKLNEKYSWEMALISQMIISALIITSLELITGLIVNTWLHLNVWDYSSQPYNFKGQICLLFSNLWVLLSLIAIFIDDWLRYLLFKEEKPHYKIF